MKEFKAKRGLGIDFNPERLKDCEERMKTEKLTDDQKKKLTFKQGDVLKMTADDFKDVDVVTLYLLPDVNKRLKPILQKGLKPGARVVSHDFDMGADWMEDKKEEVKSNAAIRTPSTCGRSRRRSKDLCNAFSPRTSPWAFLCAVAISDSTPSETLMANNTYDAIIIGAGHNGLVTAAYLARAGYKVLVLERRDILGGCCITEELWPGFPLRLPRRM